MTRKQTTFEADAMYQGIPVKVIGPIGKNGLMYCQAQDKVFHDSSQHFRSNRRHRDLHVWEWELTWIDPDECNCLPDGKTCPACVLHQELLHGENIPF